MLAKAVSRAQLLRMEADLAEAEEAFDAVKRERPRCEACGRLEVTGGRSKLDVQIREAGVLLRTQRQAFREARNSSTVVVTSEGPEG